MCGCRSADRVGITAIDSPDPLIILHWSVAFFLGMASVKPVSVVMAGTGEYTTGYIAGQGGACCEIDSADLHMRLNSATSMLPRVIYID